MHTAEPYEDVAFTPHKFTARPRPGPGDVVVVPMLSEFGCEVVGVLYCLPRLLRDRYPGKYVIVLGWGGRAHLYKHLADEFWEVDEPHQWMRKYCLAFHHKSANLKRFEKAAGRVGALVTANDLGLVVGMHRLGACPGCSGQVVPAGDAFQICVKCGVKYPPPGIFTDVYRAKGTARWLPDPAPEKVERVRKFLRPNSVGVTARNRVTYGRNLPPVFYERLLRLLEDMGYHPVWIGEKASSLPCPCPRTTDFSVSEEAGDLEMTLALVGQLKFTVQYWTASTRLAGLVGTPYLLFESPDQIWGGGQEGYRMNLCSKGPYKLVVSHFNSIRDDQTAGLELTERAVREMAAGDYRDIIGLVESPEAVEQMRVENMHRIGAL